MTKPTLPPDLAQQVFDLGYEIVKDTDTDYYRFRALHWVEDSVLFDTPEEAALTLIEVSYLG